MILRLDYFLAPEQLDDMAQYDTLNVVYLYVVVLYALFHAIHYTYCVILHNFIVIIFVCFIIATGFTVTLLNFVER